jgi:hypothetical protein
MVENTGKTLRADTLKPLNLPEMVSVEEDAQGLPVALKTKRRQSVIAINDRWRIDDEWWRREPVVRLYYAVSLASGQGIVLSKNLMDRRWYRQSY